jgi:hypothetical protein
MSMNRTTYLDAGKCQLGCDMSVLAAGKAGLARRNLWPPETSSKSLPMRREPYSVTLCQWSFLTPTIVGWRASAAAMCGAGTFVYCTVSAHASPGIPCSPVQPFVTCKLPRLHGVTVTPMVGKSCARCSTSTARTRPAIAWSLGSCRELVRSVDLTIFADDEVDRWSIKGCPFEPEFHRVEFSTSCIPLKLTVTDERTDNRLIGFDIALARVRKVAITAKISSLPYCGV